MQPCSAAVRTNLFFSWFKELGKLGSRLLKGARVVSQLHGLNTAELREQLFDNTLKQKQHRRSATLSSLNLYEEKIII